VIWSEKVRCSSKMKPRFQALQNGRCQVKSCYFGQLFFESDEQEFSLRKIKSEKISRTIKMYEKHLRSGIL